MRSLLNQVYTTRHSTDHPPIPTTPSPPPRHPQPPPYDEDEQNPNNDPYYDYPSPPLSPEISPRPRWNVEGEGDIVFRVEYLVCTFNMRRLLIDYKYQERENKKLTQYLKNSIRYRKAEKERDAYWKNEIEKGKQREQQCIFFTSFFVGMDSLTNTRY